MSQISVRNADHIFTMPCSFVVFGRFWPGGQLLILSMSHITRTDSKSRPRPPKGILPGMQQKESQSSKQLCNYESQWFIFCSNMIHTYVIIRTYTCYHMSIYMFLDVFWNSLMLLDAFCISIISRWAKDTFSLTAILDLYALATSTMHRVIECLESACHVHTYMICINALYSVRV
jgi:hypothetical protein